MTPELANYLEAGRSLDADEREVAALALQRVEDTEQVEIDAAWDDAVVQRLDDLLDGNVAPVSGRQTRALGRALLNQRRA